MQVQGTELGTNLSTHCWERRMSVIGQTKDGDLWQNRYKYDLLVHCCAIVNLCRRLKKKIKKKTLLDIFQKIYFGTDINSELIERKIEQ